MENTVTISVAEYDELRELKAKYDQKVAEVEAIQSRIYVYFSNYSFRPDIYYTNIEEATKEVIAEVVKNAEIKMEEARIREKEKYEKAPLLQRFKYSFTKSIE
jgi:hypothetical protein